MSNTPIVSTEPVSGYDIDVEYNTEIVVSVTKYEHTIYNNMTKIATLGARDFSSAVSGFCQVFVVTRAKSLWSRALLL